jgi:Heavy metal binding domain
MDAEVLQDQPGTCPICKMTLEPVRIDTAWSCPNHAAVIRDKAGACPIDKRELVQVIVAKFWTCPDSPNTKLGDPGKCSDGSPRKFMTELRAHGDHNPRHGGQFFMAEDKWHHLEGTAPSASLVRMFFYDNFTKPLSPKSFTGRVVFEENGKEIASFPLAAARNGQTLEAQIKGGPAQLTKETPLKLAAKIKFDVKTPEQRFDFTFDAPSKEPPTSSPNATAKAATPASGTGAPAAAGTPSAGAAAPAPATPAATPASATASAAQTAPPSPTAGTPGLAADAAASTMSRTDAAQLADNLPNSPAELLKLLEQREREVNQAIQEGQYGYVYIPAMLCKDIALAIEDHVSELPDARRAQASVAVRQLVLAAWELDYFGDLGNKEKINDAYRTFSAAFAGIKAAYGASR